MNQYSKVSMARLATCRQELQEVFRALIRVMDVSILCGRRNRSEQNRLYNIGATRCRWPDSRHNIIAPGLSAAIDAAPYPIDWDDTDRFTLMAGVVIGIGFCKGIDIRWGGDWDGDRNLKDNRFNDLCHFELR